jgi:hypothetical protein
MSDELYGPVSFAIGMLCFGLPAIVGTIALPFVVMHFYYKRQNDILKELKATGYAGEALIMGLEPTGLRFFGSRGGNDGIKQWHVTMDVHIPNFPNYTVTKTMTLGEDRADRIQPGTVITVLADPKVPQRIGIVWDKSILNDLPSERR